MSFWSILLYKRSYFKSWLISTLRLLYFAADVHRSQKLGQYQRIKELGREQNDELVATSACRRSRRVGESQENNIGGSYDVTVFDSVDGVEDNGEDLRYTNENSVNVETPEEPSDNIMAEAGVEMQVDTLLEY